MEPASGRSPNLEQDEAQRDLPSLLRREVRLLGDLLGQVISEAGGPDLLADVERLRAATVALRTEATDANRAAVVGIVGTFDLERAEAVAQAFTIWFQLVNLAEEHHRVRDLRERGREPGPVAESLAAAAATVRDWEGSEELSALLDRLEITPVLTAHPTEARRRAVVEALERIAALISALDDSPLSHAEEAGVHRRLLEEIAILWSTNQLRAQRPTPLDEVRGIMAMFDETIFRVAPAVYRELDRALDAETAGARAPSFPSFLRWGSWVGGDRDGNPAVTADVTRETLAIHADHVLRGLENVTRRIARAMTTSAAETPPGDELLEALEADEHVFPFKAAELEEKMPDAPHRRMMILMAARLKATREESQGAYATAQEFLEDLKIVQRSLISGGAPRLAYGELQHLVWQAETFGFHLASLEIRQHASMHATVLEELAPGASTDPVALHRLATDGWPTDTIPASADALEVLTTFSVMYELQQRYGAEACRRYVVSFTRSAADVVAVRALARLAVPDGLLQLDVVPLFEGRHDLEDATAILEELFALKGSDAWLRSRGNRLEVMLGYSDSAKDVGMLSANFVLYQAQAELAAWAKRRGIILTLFHGRGGALGRGGGPTNRAIWAQAPGSVAGRFKVTEQGEITFARYANPRIAQRHLEQVTNAVLLASTPTAEAAAVKRHEDTAVRMAEASEAAYRRLVDTEGFTDFFVRATPIDEIGRLNIASRPARRPGGTRFEDLRAIPWVFAWSQARCNLPGWFGLGSGLAAVAEEPGGLEELRAMLRDWPFFTSLMENAELSLLKADLPIAQLYLELGERPDLATMIEDEFRLTERLVLEVTGRQVLLESQPRLRRDIELRNPYIDALSFLQLRLLRELRAGEPSENVSRLVQLTVNGVAAGLQNTG